MKRKRRTFSKSFKEKAVALSETRGNVKEIAEELGISANILSRWRRESIEYSTNSFPGRGKPKQTEQEKEISILKAELADVRMERDILKKAIRIFS